MLMSRTGVEAKPPWRNVPQPIQQHVAEALGAQVIRAMRVWGGYGPTPTFRLVLADGRHAFFKGTFQESNEFARNALLYEERIYRELRALLGTWMPQLYAAFHHDDWHVLILEDLGPKSVPPWTSGRTRAITSALAAFHQSSTGVELPDWLPGAEEELAKESWTRTREDSQGFRHIATLSGEESHDALLWWQMISPMIEQLLAQPALKAEPYALLHGDVRSDNLRFIRERLYLFDWPSITVGRPELDITAFAQSVTVEGGPSPEQVMTWYAEKFPVRSDAIDCALAWWLTYFADRAWRPDIPGLPRLRRFQSQQLGILALWAARRWSLPSPTWAKLLLV